MRKKFPKLQKLLKNKKLNPSHIEEHRDCDATIAILLGFTDVEQDTDKEWIADIPSAFREFDCIGRCVVPKFTSVDALKLYNYMIKSAMIKEPIFGVVYNRNSGIYSASLYDGSANASISEVEAPTFSLAVCKLFVQLSLGDKPARKTRKKRNVKKTRLG